MWGKERGHLDINQDENFGNVLPNSIRKFQFTWEGEQNSFDIGPYSAVVTLNYGEDGKKNVSATAYFWIVPLVPVTIGLLLLTLFLLLLYVLIRRYVRRALMLEHERLLVRVRTQPLVEETNETSEVIAVPRPTMAALIAPLREGVIDLRSLGGGVTLPARELMPHGTPPSLREEIQRQLPQFPTRSVREFIKKYKLFFLFVTIVVAGSVGVLWYFDHVLVSERQFHIQSVQTSEEKTQ